MKAIITGASGAVGTALRQQIEQQGGQAVAWDRSAVPIDDYQAMEDFLRQEKPDALFHLAIASRPTGRENEGWIVNHHWPSELAWAAKELGITMIFTSTVMVFSNQAQGPFTPYHEPDEIDGYGGEKLRAERQVFRQNHGARVVRLGWQIGDAPGSNNMIDFFHQRMRQEGVINASSQWRPACSFLPDTADALIRLVEMAPGLYHLDGNPCWTFFDIANALNELHGNQWRVNETTDFVYDQRMCDNRLTVRSIGERLPALTAR